MQAPRGATVFQYFTDNLQKMFLEGKGNEVRRGTITLRVVAIAAMAFTALAGVSSLSLGFGLSRFTFGLSNIIFLPAAGLLFLACFEAYKVYRCADIIIQRANNQEGTVGYLAQNGADVALGAQWVQRLRAEIDGTLVLQYLMNRPQTH